MRSAKFDVEDPSGAGAVSLLTEAFRVHGVFDILPALKKRRGFLRRLVWFQPEHFRRVPVSSIGLTAPRLRRLRIGPALGLATKEPHTKTCALYPRSQEPSLTALLGKNTLPETRGPTGRDAP